MSFEPSDTQLKFLQATERIVFYGGGAGGGKALKNGSLVLTPNAWVKIEDLKIGDEVVTPFDGVQRVIGTFPQGVVDIYDVEFADGRVSQACGNHLWYVNGYNKQGYVTASTLSIKNHIDSGNKCFVPINKVYNYNHSKSSNIDYYEVGSFLGNNLDDEYSYVPDEIKNASSCARELFIQGFVSDRSGGMIIFGSYNLKASGHNPLSISVVVLRKKALKY